MMRLLRTLSLAATAAIWLGGCAGQVTRYDYTAFRQAAPRSIIILPPTNQSPDINASGSILATATYPVAEDGYYVFPVALVVQMFKENGVTSPDEIAQLPFAKLHEVFGADAALYINVKRYGVSYQIVASNVIVELEGRLVDLRTGDLLWQGEAVASNQEGRGDQGGLVGMLITALVEQIANNLTDPSYRIGAIANNRLLTAGRLNGLLYGPRSPQYEKQ
jgi:hypothetical protein